MIILEILKAILYGILEGITEWLPISSTGHLILLQDLVPFAFTEDKAFLEHFWEMFQVVIQLGAILAVVVLFWHRLWPFSAKKSAEEKRVTWRLWLKVIVASIPAALVGIVADKFLEKVTGKDIDGWLFNSFVVAIALIVYGIVFLFMERIRKKAGDGTRVTDLNDLRFSTALGIGLFQALSIVPGTSRSGSTILGSTLLGVARTPAAEFSFFMAIPVMVGASGIKLLKFGKWIGESGAGVPAMAWITLAVGCIVSFAVSMLAIRFLLDFVKKHSFAPFGIYRIALGILVLIVYLCGR